MYRNLEVHREPPSVWASDQETSLETWALALVIAGATLMASAMRRQSLGRWSGIALGVACMAAGLLIGRGSTLDHLSILRLGGSRKPGDQAIDEASEHSFPASNPPSSMQVA